MSSDPFFNSHFLSSGFGVSAFRRFGVFRIRRFGVFSLLLFVAGCGQPGTVQVDLTTTPIRFIVDHKGWPRPFWLPRVNEFAIADDQDELIWHLKSSDPKGEPADQLAFIYGRVPKEFYQVFPLADKAPPALQRNRTYYVAAGDERNVYRMAFSLPMEALELQQRRLQEPPPSGRPRPEIP